MYSNRLRTLTYVNAGHNPPLLLRATGTVERLSVGGPVLGMFRDASYAAGAATMMTGDRLVMYTDGVTEAFDDGDEEFGEDRLVVAASVAGPLDGRTVHASIVQAHAAFTGDAPLRDDLTLLIAVGR